MSNQMSDNQMKIKLTFLGTGTSTGVPVLGCHCDTCSSANAKDKRLRSSVLMEVEDGPTLLIDAGPDFRYQMLRSQTEQLDAILLTHEHYDHVGGLDDVRGLNYSQKRDISVYAQPNVVKAVMHNLFYAFSATPYPGSPRILLNEIADDEFTVGGVRIETLPVMHGDLPIIGFRIGPLAYITDASQVPDETIEKASGVDTLVLNALGPLPHRSHLNLEQAIGVARRIGARRTLFTHISHKMPRYDDMRGALPEGMELAWDGLKVLVG